MAYLSDSDILDWNNRIPNKEYYINARYSASSGQPTITFSKNRIFNNNGDVVDVGEPDISFRFAFSIAGNRETEFKKIFEKLVAEGFENFVRNGSGTYTKLSVSEKIVKSVTKSNHSIFQKEYMRTEYLFSGGLSSIMGYVGVLEQAIEFFSMIWGYDEEGREHCLLDFKIGDMVSPLKDKSKDMLVLDYEYFRQGNVYEIRYVVCEMHHSDKSSVIKYGDCSVMRENEITWSRNGRIDEILN